MVQRLTEFKKILHSFLLAVDILILFVSIGSAYASTRYSPFLEPDTTLTSPPVFLQAGTAGTSVIYANNTSAKSSAVAPAPTPTYYPSSYNVATGTYVSGTVEASTQTVDADYFIARSGGTATSTTAYNPFGYGLLGSTTLVSGTVENLASNDGVYMTFGSYFTETSTSYNPSGYNLVGSTTLVSGAVSNLASNDNSTYMAFSSYASSFSATSETQATVGYRSNTGTNTLSSPKNRMWNGTAWSSESEMSNAGSPVRFARVAYSSLGARYYERVIVTLSDDGNLDAYVWTGSSWSTTNNIASVGTAVNAYRPFDIEYEKTTGRALLAYFTNTASEIGYKIWNGSAWSGQSTYDLVSGSTADVYWIRLAQNPTSGSNELALVCVDATNSDAYALVWSGSSFGDKYILTTSLTGTTEDVAVAYEQSNGYANFAYATGNDAHVVRRTGTGSYTDNTVDLTGSGRPAFFSMKADPASNRLMLGALDVNSKLHTADWSGTAWSLHGVQDSNTDFSASRDFDISWEPSGSKVLMAWGTAWNQLSYKTWTPSGGWSADSNIAMAGGHAWVQLRTNPRSVGAKILGATLDSNNDVGSLKWDGTTLTGTAGAFTTDTTVTTYECFELEFQKFADPIEFTSEVELAGTGNTSVWSQLVWTGDSAWNTASVTVTMQLYNWNTLGYPSSGDGYTTYVSSAIPNTDETKAQTITNNPQDYRDVNGNWIMKIRGVKSTGTQFQFRADWVEYKPTKAEYASEVEFTGSSNTQSWCQLVWTIDSAWTTGSVSVTIQVYNYTGVGEYPTSGNGYISYTSSSTADTDETKNQTITTNPTGFQNGTGYWKIKVKGVKSTTTQFNFKADWGEFKPSYYNEYTASTEFLFSSMTENTPTQLNFTVVGEYDIASVLVTIQVWNYSSSPQAYVISGEGYLTYTSSGVNETKFRLITTDPHFYSSEGNAKIKITGVFATTTQYQQKFNQVKLVYSYSSSSNYNYVLKIINQESDPWQIRLRAYTESNIGRLNNCTIYFRNASDADTSGQVYIVNGNYTQQAGPWNDLSGSVGAERRILVSLDASNSEVSYVFVYLEILIPNKTTYLQYVITFEIT